MGLIKEPLDVDFYVDPRPMTKEDEKAISDYIKADKLRRSKKAQKRSTAAKRVTQGSFTPTSSRNRT
jgi:hypothetical protein